MKDKATTPVTIITGFLGAGKTTLLNEILRHNKDTNFLIIENEAGNINIDSELIQRNNKSNVFELTGGCICCSLSTELGTVLNSIILSSIKYDYVLIEASGIADTSHIVNMFSGVRIQRYFNLDAVVGLVDASSFLKRIDDFTEVRSQVVKSDILIINKCDLLSSEQINEIEQKLATINPLARIEKTKHAKVKGMQILNSACFSPSTIQNNIIDFTNLKLENTKNSDAHQIQALNYTIPGDFDMEKISIWLDDFLFINRNNVLRIKAIVSIHDMAHKMILQSVGVDYHISQGIQWTESDSRESKIVIIGTDLQEAEIRNSFYSLLIKVEAL